MDYAMTQMNLGSAYWTLAMTENKAENCANAKAAYEEALNVFRQATLPLDYEKTIVNLENLARFCEGE